ncbi:MAG: UbiX family flavin prenyltransferase [Saprospiraceae bacterium]
MNEHRKIVLAIGGSSGSVYAFRLMQKCISIPNLTLGIVLTENAKINWSLELGEFKKEDWPYTFYSAKDFFAPFASGSAKYDSMVVCPCSMGLLARIANGISDDLITRAADVMLKERRKLVIVPRETPYNLIHLNNMKQMTEAGAVICPASPSFYSKPDTIEKVVDTVVDRVMDLLNLPVETYRWNEKIED